MNSENIPVPFDKNRLEKFIKKDKYVNFLFRDLKKNGNSTECSLNVLHSLVLADESLLNDYEML